MCGESVGLNGILAIVDGGQTKVQFWLRGTAGQIFVHFSEPQPPRVVELFRQLKKSFLTVRTII
jgi:hypothetical protein